MTSGFSGGCLCQNIHYECSIAPQMAAHCHCDDCRRSSGTGHCTHVVVPQDALSIEGDVTFFDKPADSGNTVSRGFCTTCGSALYSLNSGMPGMAFLRASSLDDPTVIEPSLIVYASRAPSWDVMNTALPAFAEMPDQIPEEAMNPVGHD